MTSLPYFSDYKEEARFHLKRANEFEESGDLVKALEECDTAILIDPDLSDAYNLRGIIFEKLGQSRKAIRAYKKAAKIDPKSEEARQNIHDLEAVLEKDRDIVTISTYSYPLEAEIARGKLESEGIWAFVADDYMVTMNWLYSTAIGGVKLQVKESDAQRALQILNHNAPIIEDELHEDNDSPRCPRCMSFSIQYQTFEPRLVFLSWLLLSFPLPFVKKKWKCMACGCSWKEGEELAESGTNFSEFVCPMCNKPVYEESKICLNCGERLVVVTGYCCSECGHDVEEDMETCPHCGEPLDETEE